MKKRNDAPLKDAKYRGKAANRRDLFDDPENMSVSSQQTEDDRESDEDSEMEQENSKDNISEKSDESSHDSSDVSADEEDGDDQDDQQTRRDKVRTLLAQETRYFLQSDSKSNTRDLSPKKYQNPFKLMQTRDGISGLSRYSSRV